MKLRLSSMVVAFLLGLLLIPQIIDGIKYLTQDRRPPIFVHNVIVKGGPFKPGDWMTIEITRTKIRLDCQTDWDSWLIGAKGEQHTVANNIPGSGPRFQGNTIFIRRPVPLGAEPGRYLFRSTGTALCPDGVHYITQPDTPVEVVK